MQQQTTLRESNRKTTRLAFTLVEMLVAVALVLLMMSLFAEVFSLATSTMSRQKGLSENDQRARMVATLLGSDFRKRSFRDVVPFVSGMTVMSPNSSTKKKGYLEYSENDPTNDADDVLRLTIDTTQTQQDIGRDLELDNNQEVDVARDDFLLYGHTVEIGPGGVEDNPNQPEGDDGIFSGPFKSNNAGQSTAAEVVWFLRGGNLYRRAMLIRSPYRSDLQAITKYDATTESDPPTNVSIITGDYTSFWKDFDYSAFYNSARGRVQFHILNSLNNTPTAAADDSTDIGGLTVPISLGIPPLRFGYSPNVTGFAPVEFDQSDAFIGSFTHEETSHQDFKHPGVPVTKLVDDPYTMPIQLQAATNNIQQFSGGSRIGEDLLLSNVVSFDIKIWDPGVGNGPDQQPGFAGKDDDQDGTVDNLTERGATYSWTDGTLRGALSDDGSWVDLGHRDNRGFYFRSSGKDNGTGTTYGNRFDTWHPIGGLGDPPYLPARYVPAGSQLATNCPSRSTPAWQVGGGPHSAGDVILPSASNQMIQGLRFAYLCVGSGLGGPTEPNWTTSEFQTTPELIPGGATWMAVPNLIPVRALQIKIRYLDVSSGLLKDLTLVESLRDDL